MSQAWRLMLVLMAVCCLADRPMSSQAVRPPAPTSSPTLTLRIIVVSSNEDAQRLVVRLRANENFAVLAKTLSIDPSADDGGLLGALDPSTLRPELRTALQGLRPGDITPPIAVPAGFAIVQVVAGQGAEAAASGPGPATIDPANPGLAAVGSVKYVLGVSGLVEALAAQDQLSKAADWNQQPRSICDTRTTAVRTAITSLEEALRPGPAQASLSPPQLMQAHYGLGQFYAYGGRMGEAIAEFEHAYAIVTANVSEADPAALQLDEALGVAWLHKAELDNGVYEHPGDRCLLTPGGVAPFARTEASAKAVDYFQRYLSHRPEDLEVKWLLNVAYMTLGGYPHKVPAALRIPPATFASADDIGRFVDVAADAGLRSFAMAGGLIVDDFDNDGRYDVVTSSYDTCAPMHFFQRQADGRFVENGAKAGLGEQIGGLSLVQTDYDNDGCLDILLMRGAWERPQRKELLHNHCHGSFTDVTVASGVALAVTSTQAAVWTDIDNDGFLDLFIGNEGAPAQLFLNNRNGTFTDIGAAAGVNKTAFIKGATAIDFDNDGWQDLYVSNLSGDNFLYRNNHDRTFTELGRALGVPGSRKGFVTWAFDYDNDGWQDLFATSYFTSVDETLRTYLELPHNATTLKLYKNLGNGNFRDVTHEVGLDKVYMPMGANFGDVDNDGFLDIYLGTGNPSYAVLVPSVLLRNRGGTSFVDITSSSGTGELHKGHGVAFADLDNDGNDEIVFEVGGAVPGDAHALRLFHNPGHANDWLTLKLVGVKSNHAAIGARIAVTVEGESEGKRGRRTVYRTVSSGGSFGASPLAQHIGLGRVDRIVNVEIWWPTSNTRQRFSDVGKNQTLRIEEFAAAYTTLERPPLPLTGRKTSDGPTH
jgi:tetratricopeptide (TPR) repeat protein